MGVPFLHHLFLELESLTQLFLIGLSVPITGSVVSTGPLVFPSYYSLHYRRVSGIQFL